MRPQDRFTFLAPILWLVLVVAVCLPAATPFPAAADAPRPFSGKPIMSVSPSPTPTATPTLPPGADLGAPSDLQLLDHSSCGAYMTTEALDSQCDPASANHWIVLGWKFDQGDCSAKPCARPEGFNILRTDGSRSIFATQAVSAGQTTMYGTVLKVKSDENVGACFAVQPYRGTSDLGRVSDSVCVHIVDDLQLYPTRWGTAHSNYSDDGMFCSSPKSNPAAYQLMYMSNGANSGTGIFTGYVNRSDNGCNDYDDFYQGLLYFDLNKLAGKKVLKAKLELRIVAGALNTGNIPGNMNGSEHNVNVDCATNVGYPTNVNVAKDPVFPATVGVGSPIAISSGVGDVDVDITSMVKTWLSRDGSNHGIVLSPGYLNYDQLATFQASTHVLSVINWNVDCLSQFSAPKLDVETTQ